MMIEKAHPWDAGWDLRTPRGAIVAHGSLVTFNTGEVADIPQGHVGLILGKSGLAQEGIQVLGGVIDAGYTGEIAVTLTRTIHGAYRFEDGDKIAQLVVLPLSSYAPASASQRGESGFGSTGR